MIYHIFVVGIYINVIYRDRFWKLYPLRWKYLTQGNLLIQLSYFVFATLTDVIKRDNNMDEDSNTSDCVFHRFRSIFLTSVAWPLGFFIQTTFWILYIFVNRDAVFPAELIESIPKKVHHVYHSTVIPMLYIEMAVNPGTYQERKRGIYITQIVFILTEILTVEIPIWMFNSTTPIHVRSEDLTFMNDLIRFVMFMTSLFLTKKLYQTGECLYKLTCRS